MSLFYGATFEHSNGLLACHTRAHTHKYIYIYTLSLPLCVVSIEMWRAEPNLIAVGCFVHAGIFKAKLNTLSYTRKIVLVRACIVKWTDTYVLIINGYLNVYYQYFSLKKCIHMNNLRHFIFSEIVRMKHS